MYKIILSNGHEIKDLKLNGNNVVSQTKIDESNFKKGMDLVTITNGEHTIIYKNAFLLQQKEYDDGFYLVFAEKTQEQMIAEKLKQELEAVQYALDFVIMQSMGGGEL